MTPNFPYILGCDLAGTVVACGADVRGIKPGDRVWGTNQGLFGRQGTFAELAAVDERWLYPTPADQPDTEAAAGRGKAFGSSKRELSRAKRCSSTAARAEWGPPSFNWENSQGRE